MQRSNAVGAKNW